MRPSIKDDFTWLMGPSAAKLIVQVIEELDNRRPVLKIAKSLRKSTSSTRAALLMEQAQLRIRGRAKFENAASMFFTRRGLEQSSGQDLACYKASLFGSKQRVADVCCGIGGDLIALASRSVSLNQSQPNAGSEKVVTTVGIDSDEVTSMFASRNLELAGIEALVSQNKGWQRKQWVQTSTFEATTFDDFDAIHIDPDRRIHRRTVRGDQFSPDLNEVFSRISDALGLCVKVAPATRMGDYLPENSYRQWIGDRRECKQQLVWSGAWGDSITGKFGFRTATKVEGDATVSFSAPESEVGEICPTIGRISKYLFEPHPTVLAAGLTDALALRLGAERAAKDIPYLLCDQLLEHDLLSRFKILEVTSLKANEILAGLKKFDVGQVEWKCRGIDQKIYAKFAKLKGTGSKRRTVLLTRLGSKRKRAAVIAKRV